MDLTALTPYLPLLEGTPLFAGLGQGGLCAVLERLEPAVRRYGKGEALLNAGDAVLEIGVVLEGRAEAVKYTRAGGSFTLQRLEPGRVYGDVLSGASAKSPVTVTALTPAVVMLLRVRRLFEPGGGEETRRLLANLVGVISDKFFALDARMDLLLTNGLRRRAAAFLLDAAPKGPGGAPPGGFFSVPFTRAQLASYLGCERSALSRELSRMARDGLIEVQRSAFRLLDMEGLAGGS